MVDRVLLINRLAAVLPFDPASHLAMIFYGLIIVVAVVEIVFYFVFHYHLVPRANQWVEPQPFRDYGKDRVRLLNRILDRTIKHTEMKGMDQRKALHDFFVGFFERVVHHDNARRSSPPLNEFIKKLSKSTGKSSEKKSLETQSTTSTETDTDSMDDELSTTSTLTKDQWTISGMGRADLTRLFGWAFFGRHVDHFDDWEHDENDRLINLLAEKCNFRLDCHGWGGVYQARCLNLEDTNSLHRPFIVYMGVLVMMQVAGLVFRLAGFHRVQSESTGVTGWYRPARDEASTKLLPLIFHHGLAPGGLFFYIPFILLGLLTDGRACFLFENYNISCRIGFKAISEVESVAGFAEIVDRYLPRDAPVSLCGHSFGSVPMTWMLNSSHFRDRIKQYVLLDPVSILISEPAVMVNFLYKRQLTHIRLFAASELFTEYYLRRFFCYYNSELWFEDLPDDVRPIVALSEHDEIVPSERVKEHIELFAADKTELIHWRSARHAFCVVFPSMWRQVKNAMLKQELSIVQQQ